MRQAGRLGAAVAVRPATGLAAALWCGLWAVTALHPAAAEAQDWVGPLTRLAPADHSLAPRADEPRTLQRRMEIARTLGRHGPADDAVELLLAALAAAPEQAGELEPALRDEVLRALSRRGAAAAVPHAVAILSSSETPVGAAFLLLAAVADRAAVRAAVAELGRESMAHQARWALLRVGEAAVLPLIEALSTPDDPAADATASANHRAAVARTLGELHARSAVAPLLSRLAASPTPVEEVALLEALGALGDAGAIEGRTRASVARAAAGALDSAHPGVGAAALRCLSVTATAAQVELLRPELSGDDETRRAHALRAIAGADPAAAIDPLRQALAGRPRGLARVALDILVDRPAPQWVALLAAQLETTAMERAASALSRIEGGAGIEPLIDAAAAMPERAPVLARALSLGLRRQAHTLPDATRQRGLAVLAKLPAGPRRLRLRALARDRDAIVTVRQALTSTDPLLRASAGLAAEYLADDRLTPALLDALTGERDAEAFRRMADAALRLDASPALDPRDPRLAAAATAPEALLLLGHRLGKQGDATTTAGRRAAAIVLRRALHGSDHTPPRTRAAAALGLALAGDRRATTALLSALDDPDDRIRLAAAHALGKLGGSDLPAALRPSWRVERSDRVRQALTGALDAASAGRPRGPERGVASLEVRVGAHEVQGGAALLDVTTADGRWRRLRTGAHGELVVVDLHAGVADVSTVR